MNCPIKEDIDKITSESKDVIRQMHKLRADLIRCKRCPDHNTCWLIKNYNHLVNTAIQEINEEWKSRGVEGFGRL
jgi:hypothetical protein